MRTVAIIQARMGSTRLPGKMLLPLAGAPLIQRVIERVSRATTLDDVVLAVPGKDGPDFAPIANGRAWLYGYGGDEADLVGRYLAAAQEFTADLIVRIPGDNPCVDPVCIDWAIENWLDNQLAFYSDTTSPAKDVDGTVQWIDGLGAEVFSYNRLQWLDRKTQGQAAQREHLHTAFVYPQPQADLRLDVNTMEEYLFIQDIYDALYPHRPQFTTADILAYLSTKEATV